MKCLGGKDGMAEKPASHAFATLIFADGHAGEAEGLTGKWQQSKTTHNFFLFVLPSNGNEDVSAGCQDLGFGIAEQLRVFRFEYEVTGDPGFVQGSESFFIAGLKRTDGDGHGGRTGGAGAA